MDIDLSSNYTYFLQVQYNIVYNITIIKAIEQLIVFYSWTDLDYIQGSKSKNLKGVKTSLRRTIIPIHLPPSYIHTII